jgi:hypothetical protein
MVRKKNTTEKQEGPRGSIKNAHSHLDETRRTINDLIQYRLSMLNEDCKDPEKIKEFRGKALRAINELFDEEA